MNCQLRLLSGNLSFSMSPNQWTKEGVTVLGWSDRVCWPLSVAVQHRLGRLGLELRGFSKAFVSNVLRPKKTGGARGEAGRERLEGRRDSFPASYSCQHLSSTDGRQRPHSIFGHPWQPRRTPSGAWMPARQCPLRSPSSPSSRQENPPQRLEAAERYPPWSEHDCMAASQLAQQLSSGFFSHPSLWQQLLSPAPWFCHLYLFFFVLPSEGWQLLPID